MNKVYFSLQKCDLKKNISALAVATDKELTPNKVIDNYFVTLICNTSHVGCVSEIYKVMRYIGKSVKLNFDGHLLEIGPKHGLLHIHCKAFVKNRNLIHKPKNNIYVRVHDKFNGYCLRFNRIKSETHNENCDKYDKGTTLEEIALKFIETQYTNSSDWRKCPWHPNAKCNDFTINEAKDFYYLKHIRKNSLKF